MADNTKTPWLTDYACPTEYLKINPDKCCPKEAAKKVLEKESLIGSAAKDKVFEAICKACALRISVVKESTKADHIRA